MTKADEAASARHLKLVAVILAVFNVVTAACSAYFLHELNQSYSSLVAQSVPTLNRLRMLGDSIDEVFRATGAATTVPVAKRREMERTRALELLQHCVDESSNLTLLIQPMLGGSRDPALDRLVAEFKRAEESCLARVQADELDEAVTIRTTAVRRAYDALQKGVDQTANQIERQTEEKNSQYAERTNSHRWFLLGVGGWPVVSFAFLAVAALGICAGVFALTRRMEPPED